MTTKVVNIRKEPYDVYIGREGRGQNGYFGNPYKLMGDTEEERETCLKSYSKYFFERIANDPQFLTKVLTLKDKTLGCFCKPKLCHGDVIANFLDNKYAGD